MMSRLVNRTLKLLVRDYKLHIVSELSTYDKTVLASRVLVLGLGDQALTGIVVGLSLTTTAVLGLVATEQRSGTYN